MRVEIKAGLETTWEKLKQYAYLHSGSIIPVTLKNGEQIEVEVCRDENHERFFVFKDCYKDRCQMNDDWTTEGGYEMSKGRKTALAFFDLLPDDLQAAIVPTKIVQVWNGERHEMEDKLFMLSATQVFGKNGEREKQDVGDSQLDIFKRVRNRVKEWNGDTWFWWLRSAYNAGYFSMVGYNGSEDYDNADSTDGLVLGFRI